MILDIHLEYIDDKAEKLKKLTELNKPIILSVVPCLLDSNHEVFSKNIYPKNLAYPREFLEVLRQIVKKPNVILGQQGYVHYCEKCFQEKNKKDPHHENYCLYQEEKSVEEQREIIKKGKDLIEKVLGVSPKVYSPPNHQYNENTLQAVELEGFKYFAIRNLLSLPVFKKGNLTILPEADFNEQTSVVYVHYDEKIFNEEFEEFLKLVQDSESLEEMKINFVPEKLIQENYEKIIERKKQRDFKK